MRQPLQPLPLCLLLAGCGASAPPPSSPAPTASAPATAPTPTSASAPGSGSASASPAGAAPARAPVPAGGIVSIGQVVAPKDFDPNPVLVALKPKFLDCYGQARASNPTLRGKLRLRIQVTAMGSVTSVDADPGDPAYDPELLVCLGDAFKTAAFPKPAGTATLSAPLVFRP